MVSRKRSLGVMFWVTLFFAPLSYLLGVLVIATGAAVYLLSRLKLLVVNAFLRRPLDVMSGSDALMLSTSFPYFTRPECPLVTHAVLVLRGRLDMSKLRQHFVKHVVDARNPTTGLWLNPRWRQRPARRFNYFVWEEDDQFDVQHHFRMGEQSYTDEASLVKLIERAAHTPLSTAWPQWEVLVMSKVATPGEDDECAILLRVHHCLGDGRNLTTMIGSLWDEPCLTVKDISRTGTIDPSVQLAKSNPLFQFLASSRQKRTVSAAENVITNVLKTWLTTPRLVMEIILQKPERNSLHGPTLSGRRLMALSKVAAFQLLKDISSALDCSISDVFHFCLIGAIKRCNEEASNLSGISADKYITFFSPIYLLKARAGWTENGFVPVLLRYPLQGESPRQQLRAIAAITKAVICSAQPPLNFATSHALGNHMPLALVQKFLIPSFKFSVTTTNVVGFSGSVSLLGLQVTKMFFLPVCFGERGGLSCSLMSYNGCVHLGVTVDRAVAPDDRIAQRLADDWLIELQNLHNLVKNEDLNAK